MKNIDFLINKEIAHRGIFDNTKVPENSIKAFLKAINKKYTIELDVHLTKDNEIVVFHDDTLERMTKKSGKIIDYTLKELRNIKLLDTNYTIPSLKEVLDLVDGKVGLLIELKYDRKHHLLEKKLIEVLSDYKGEFAVQSFSPSIVSYFRFHKKDYIRGLLVNKIKCLDLVLLFCKPDFLSVNKNIQNNKSIIKFKKNKKVLAWTIKSKNEKEKYKDSFDNLICNIDECI